MVVTEGDGGRFAMAAVAASPLASEGIGKAWPATSIAASSSSITVRSVAVFAAGSANNPVIAL